MLNAATLAAIVAACWAHPSGQAYLAKIAQIEAAAIACGNPCCARAEEVSAPSGAGAGVVNRAGIINLVGDVPALAPHRRTGGRVAYARWDGGITSPHTLVASTPAAHTVIPPPAVPKASASDALDAIAHQMEEEEEVILLLLLS